MKVLSLIPTKDSVHPACLAALYSQDCGDYALLISVLDQIPLHQDREKNRYLNIVRNRNNLRKMALASDAEWFLWIDSDTVLPKNAVTEFLKVSKPFMGGWYKKIGAEEWVSSRIVAKNTLYCFQEPQPDLAEVDMIGLGCAMMHRSVLEKIPFSAGTEKYAKNVFGALTFWGDCLEFSIAAKAFGIKAHMVPTIICGHIPPPPGVIKT